MPKATDPQRSGRRGSKGKPCSASRETCQRIELRPADGVFRDGERTVASVRAPHRLPQDFELRLRATTSRRAMTVTLHVCITCRAGQSLPEGETTPGARLHAAILGVGVPEGVNVVPVECLSACSQG